MCRKRKGVDTIQFEIFSATGNLIDFHFHPFVEAFGFKYLSSYCGRDHLTISNTGVHFRS